MSIQYFKNLENLLSNINQHLLIDGDQKTPEESIHKMECALQASWLQLLSKDIDLAKPEFELRIFDKKSLTRSLNDVLVAQVSNASTSNQYLFQIDNLCGLPAEIPELSESSNEFLLGKNFFEERVQEESGEFSRINKPLSSEDVVPIIHLSDSIETYYRKDEERARALQKKKPKSTTVLKLMGMANSFNLPIFYGSSEEILYTWILPNGKLSGDEGGLNATPWCRKYTRRKSKDGIKPMFVYFQSNGLLRKENIIHLFDKGFVLPEEYQIGNMTLEKAEAASQNHSSFQLNYLQD